MVCQQKCVTSHSADASGATVVRGTVLETGSRQGPSSRGAYGPGVDKPDQELSQWEDGLGWSKVLQIKQECLSRQKELGRKWLSLRSVVSEDLGGDV